jgi:alpha-galactosidase
MRPLLADIAAAGFTPGLWIAPFLVGNRSRLFAEHPDWVVQSANGGPLAHMRFYGEFRWHKRSEEYYVLDVTNPEAADYIRTVFRTWRRDWGAGYFKTDFMNAGMEYGPGEARWHEPGLSRVEIWLRMARIIREEIGEALWLGCGCPLWAAVGFVDAVRIGRDVGVSWHGEYSAESLLRDQVSRNHASGILWQADPDCVLLRDRFHDLTDEEVRSLLLFAGLSGGVLMTSDKLDEIPPERAKLFAKLLKHRAVECEFPQLDRQDGLIVQQARIDGTTRLNLFNTTNEVADFLCGDGGRTIAVAPHASVLLREEMVDALGRT